MQQKPISGRELRQARQLLLNQLALGNSSTDGIAGELLHLAVSELPLDEPCNAARRFKAITGKEIRDAFKKWVRPDGFVEVVHGPK